MNNNDKQPQNPQQIRKQWLTQQTNQPTSITQPLLPTEQQNYYMNQRYLSQNSLGHTATGRLSIQPLNLNQIQGNQQQTQSTKNKSSSSKMTCFPCGKKPPTKKQESMTERNYNKIDGSQSQQKISQQEEIISSQRDIILQQQKTLQQIMDYNDHQKEEITNQDQQSNDERNDKKIENNDDQKYVIQEERQQKDQEQQTEEIEEKQLIQEEGNEKFSTAKKIPHAIQFGMVSGGDFNGAPITHEDITKIKDALYNTADGIVAHIKDFRNLVENEISILNKELDNIKNLIGKNTVELGNKIHGAANIMGQGLNVVISVTALVSSAITLFFSDTIKSYFKMFVDISHSLDFSDDSLQERGANFTSVVNDEKHSGFNEDNSNLLSQEENDQIDVSAVYDL